MLPLMLQLDIASLFCIGLMFVGVGMFILGPFFIGWLDERDDRYAGIKWSKKLGTSRSEDRIKLYHTWEEKQAIAKRNSEALDVYIQWINRDGSLVMGVKNHGGLVTAQHENSQAGTEYGSLGTARSPSHAERGYQVLTDGCKHSGQGNCPSPRENSPARRQAEQEWQDMVAGILHDLATKSTRELIGGYHEPS